MISRSALLIVMFAMLSCEKTPIPKKTDTPLSQPTPYDRRVNDVHTHISPYAFTTFLEQTESVGVHRIVNMSGGAADDYRAFSQKMAREHPERVALFANIDWEGIDDPEFGRHAAQKLRQAVLVNGFAGLKISKALGLRVRGADGELIAVDDERLDPIWEEAGRLGIVVAIHTSDPKAFFEKPGPQNERHKELSHAPSWSFYGDEFPSRVALLEARDRLVARHPKTMFMLLHFANNPEDVDYVDRLLDSHPNVLVDVAARIGEIGRHDAKRVREIFQKHRSRILFATDIQLNVVPKGERAYLQLTLGSVSEEPPKPEQIAPFYADHFSYFESTGAPIAHPVPIQGDWKVNPIGLDHDILDDLYFKNSEREIFAPWLGREKARDIVRSAAGVIRTP